LRTPGMKEELISLEERKDILQRTVKSAPAPAPLLHPNLAEVYRQKVAKLEEELNRAEVCGFRSKSPDIPE
jgi:site-specific DNA recombinase